MKIAQHAALEQIGMQRRHAVDRVRADAGQIRHAHALLAGLVDQRQPRHPRLVAAVADAHFVQEPSVDLVDDFEMARQQRAKQR